jgi:hypothetical protein
MVNINESTAFLNFLNVFQEGGGTLVSMTDYVSLYNGGWLKTFFNETQIIGSTFSDFYAPSASTKFDASPSWEPFPLGVFGD